jgi:ABC-type transport system involved in cytochrome bd biosynthesis fused ATPase/permease subunit
MEKSVYLNQRIRKDVVKKLRKYERENKLTPSISSTIEDMLRRIDTLTNYYDHA